jgi:putrescine transport system permease protein
MLIFIPAVGEFVIPELLGGPETLTIGKILWGEFFHNRDWPISAAIAVALMLLTVVPLMIIQKLQRSPHET